MNDKRREFMRNYLRAEGWELRMQALRAYGGTVPACACCGEADPRFLTIDHKEGSGQQHRKSIGCRGGGKSFYRRLRQMGYPQDVALEVLCFNCNLGRQCNGGVCPHKEPQGNHWAKVDAARILAGIKRAPHGQRRGRPRRVIG